MRAVWARPRYLEEAKEFQVFSFKRANENAASSFSSPNNE
jgi:hypothetical protein